MEPRIQYAQTEDGVSIAYWTMGEGEPLVMIPTLPFSHVQLEWKVPAYARWYEHHARERLLLRYDPRGAGLSQRDVGDFSLEAQLQDLAAVVDRAGLPRFALWAWSSYACPIAVTYAARFPGRVTRLVLFSPSLSAVLTPALDVVREENWELYLKTVAHMVMGWPEGNLAKEIGAMMAESVTPKTAAVMGEVLKDFDITPLLSDVLAPTLVITRREAPTPLDAVTSVAARLPDARLAVLEGDSLAFLDDPEVVTAIDEFLGIMPGETETQELPSGTSIILFADIANSTALTEELGDAAFREKARDLDTSLREAISSAGGTAIEGKLLGDGVLAVFGAAREAIACAQEMHRLTTREGSGRDPRPASPDPLLLHVGIHAGDVIREDGPDGRANVFGGAVNVAARISDASEAGETLVSGTVRDLARTSAGVVFEDKGERNLKGVSDPVRVWAVAK